MKLFILSVGQCGKSVKLAHLDFINKKNIELIFKLNTPFAMFFQAEDGRFKSFCTVLKERIRLEGSSLEDSRLKLLQMFS